MQTWRERLLDPAPLTETDFAMAKDWTTCAVGEQQKQHPHVVKLIAIVPRDSTLTSLGVSFYNAFPDREKALSILDRIEDRVLELKREEGSSEGA